MRCGMIPGRAADRPVAGGLAAYSIARRSLRAFGVWRDRGTASGSVCLRVNKPLFSLSPSPRFTFNSTTCSKTRTKTPPSVRSDKGIASEHQLQSLAFTFLFNQQFSHPWFRRNHFALHLAITRRSYPVARPHGQPHCVSRQRQTPAVLV